MTQTITRGPQLPANATPFERWLKEFLDGEAQQDSRFAQAYYSSQLDIRDCAVAVLEYMGETEDSAMIDPYVGTPLVAIYYFEHGGKLIDDLLPGMYAICPDDDLMQPLLDDGQLMFNFKFQPV